MEFDVVNYATLRSIVYAKAVRETSGSASTANNVWVTLLSMTGVGFIKMLNLSYFYSLSGSMSENTTFRITIDGGTPQVITGALPFNQGAWSLPVIDIRFDSSVLIEYRQSSATSYSATATVVWGER